MEDDTILDQESDQYLELTKMRENQNKLIVWIVFLAVLNILLFSFTPSKIGRGYLENLFDSVILNLLWLNVLGLVFGSLVALFPYKRFSYTSRASWMCCRPNIFVKFFFYFEMIENIIN